MSYVILTLVPRLTKRPKPGEGRMAVGIFEEPCTICTIGYDGKLKPCWKHTHEHILWAEKVDAVESVVSSSQDEGLHHMEDPSRTEELVEVS